MNWINNLAQVIYFRLKSATYIGDKNNLEDLGIFRLIIGTYLAATINPSWTTLCDLPDAFFIPFRYNLVSIFDKYPSLLTVQIIEVVFITLLYFIAIGIKTRWSGLLAGLILIVMTGFSCSFGKIGHNIMFSVFFILIGFSNFGVSHAIFKDKEWPTAGNLSIITGSLLLAIGMLTAGIPKAYNWIDFNLNTSGFLSWYYRSFYSFNRQDFFAALLLDKHNLIYEAIDYLTILFELGAIFAVISNWFGWRLWILLACFFHLGVVLILNINFIGHFPLYSLYVLPYFLSHIKYNKSMVKPT
jgi:hypothetical protein